MRTVSINIGSNLGDRRHNLERAIEEIRRIADTELRISEIYESQAWGYRSDNPFFNIAVEFDTDKSLTLLLNCFQAVERRLGSQSHRNTEGGYADRMLDIDIIYAGDEVVDTSELQVPHPRMQERRFVLAPLCSLSPRWRHPVTHLSAEEMLRALDESEGQD